MILVCLLVTILAKLARSTMLEQIVGYAGYVFGNTLHAFCYSSGAMTNLGTGGYRVSGSVGNK